MISGYEKYDYLFSNLKPHTIEGILIFGRDDDYIKSQKYDEVTNLENKIWADLYTNLELLLDQYASREYLLGIKALPIPRDRFPEFDAISPIVENSTGWTLLPVAGFLNEELFFEVNAKRQFPVTDIIRKSPRFDEKYADRDIRNDEGYTPEPDIFHDIQAHVPFLMNREYADFLSDIGKEFGVDVKYLPTNMNQPLGRYSGLLCEIIESMETLKGNGQFSNRDNLIIRSKKLFCFHWNNDSSLLS